MIRKIAMCLLFVALSCVGAYAAAVDGKWSAQFDTPVGTEKYIFELHANGVALTGKAINEHGEVAIRDGKIDGDTISFVEAVSANGMDMTITYTGKIDGETIHFVRKVGDFGQDEFTATRVK